MSRILCMVATAVTAVLVVLPASAETAVNTFGIPVAPNGGNASIHQWGGVDDSFAVNPDAEDAPVRAPRKSASPLAKDQQDADSGAPDDPDSDHFGEILTI